MTSFDVSWSDTPLVPQLNNMSCWAASAAMVVGWRDRMSIDPEAIASGSGEWAAYTAGLNPADVPTLAAAWGLVMEPPQCYATQAFVDMISVYGPLWVTAAVPGLHAIVVTGIYGDDDSSPDVIFVRINDPWHRDPGTPGGVGAYDGKPGAGSQYVLTLSQFMNEYEAAASEPGMNIQILRSDGRSQ
jgi:hypothetical protein